MKYVRITADCYIAGVPVQAGAELEVNDSVALALVQNYKAVEIDKITDEEDAKKKGGKK